MPASSSTSSSASASSQGPSTNDLLAQQSKHLADLAGEISVMTKHLNDFIEVVVRESLQPDVAIINSPGALSAGSTTSQIVAAQQLWRALNDSGTMLLDSDYQLMRQGLGRPGVDLSLDVVIDAESGHAVLSGPGLANATAVAIDGRVVVPIRRDNTTFVISAIEFRPELAHVVLHDHEVIVTVLAFGTRGITARYVGPVSTIVIDVAVEKGSN
jgi:hypothetical protein